MLLIYLSLLLLSFVTSAAPATNRNLKAKTINVVKTTGKIVGGAALATGKTVGALALTPVALAGSVALTVAPIAKVAADVAGGAVGLVAGTAKGAYHLGKALTAKNRDKSKRHLQYAKKSPIKGLKIGSYLVTAPKEAYKLGKNLKTFASKNYNSEKAKSEVSRAIYLPPSSYSDLHKTPAAENYISKLSETNKYIPFNSVRKRVEQRQKDLKKSIYNSVNPPKTSSNSLPNAIGPSAALTSNGNRAPLNSDPITESAAPPQLSN